MISKTIGFRGVPYFQTHPCWENGRMLMILIVFLHLHSEILHLFWLGLGNKAIASCMSVEGGYQYYDGCKNRDPVLRKNSDSKQQLIIIDLRSTHGHGVISATAECSTVTIWLCLKNRGTLKSTGDLFAYYIITWQYWVKCFMFRHTHMYIYIIYLYII